MSYSPNTWTGKDTEDPQRVASWLNNIEGGLAGVVNGGSISVIPEKYGAVGDGVTDDTAALQSWAASGLPLALTNGKTYLQRQRIQLTTAGQTLFGNGAKLKRTAQATSTTTTSITSGVTSQITLADASGFRTGDQIVVEQSGTYDASARTISSIVGNVVTISGTFGVSLSGTTNVRVGWRQLEILAANVRVFDVEFDGNASNWTWGRWNHTAAVWSTSGADHGIVSRCYIHDQYGDGASPGDYQTFWFTHNTVENIKGRGISWAGSTNAYGGRCLFNRFYNCDADSAVSASDGHGCIQLSSHQQDLIIHGNHCETGLIGIGSLSSTDNSDVTITGNEIRSMTTYAIEADNPTGQGVNNVLIANNRIYDSIAVLVNQQASGSSAFPSRFAICGNLFSNTAITGNYNRHVLIEGNVFTGGGTTLNYISMDSPKYLTVVGNQFEAGQYCLTIGNTFEGLSFQSNKCFGQNQRAVNIFGSGCVTPNVIQGNVIENDATANASYEAIVVASGQNKVSIKDNEIKLVGGDGGIIMSANNAVIFGNTIRCGTAPKSIRLPAGATSNWVGYNMTDVAVSDSGTTTTLVSNAAIT